MRGLSRLILVFPLMLGTLTAVADSMRCGRYIVNTGDVQSVVLDRCGEPQQSWQDGFIEEVVRFNGYYSTQTYISQTGYKTETRRVIPVYKWEYNLGRGTLLKILIFHGDTLVGIVDGPRQ